MREFIDCVMQVTKQYTTLDFALLKICLVAIGILLGVYLTVFFTQYILIVWVVAIISYVWIMYKTFFGYRK